MGYFATLLVPLLSKYRSQAVHHYEGVLWYSGSFSSLFGIFWDVLQFRQGPLTPHSVSIEMKLGQRANHCLLLFHEILRLREPLVSIVSFWYSTEGTVKRHPVFSQTLFSASGP